MPPNKINPLTILRFLHEVRKRLPQNWIKTGVTYHATAEAYNFGNEDKVEYQIYVTPPVSVTDKPIQIREHKSFAAALVELEGAINGFPQLTI